MTKNEAKTLGATAGDRVGMEMAKGEIFLREFATLDDNGQRQVGDKLAGQDNA
jgi:hypothetical protein